MRTLLLLNLFLISSSLLSQETVKGTILDFESNESLPYVNIGIIGKNIGTVSDINGNFSITLPKEFEKDTLRISMIGYGSKDFTVSDFKKYISKNSSLQLEKQINEIKEIVISEKQLKKKILGNKTEAKGVIAGFTSDSLGNEVGIRIKIKKNPTYLRNVNISIGSNEYDKIKFRLNLYNIKDDLPYQSILNENIIIESDIKEGLITVDLSEYNIEVSEDFFATLEYIEDFGGNNGLKFSACLLCNPIVARMTSQGTWEKIGTIGIGISFMTWY